LYQWDAVTHPYKPEMSKKIEKLIELRKSEKE